jgi:cation diffusion facilitator family transporter
MNMQSQRAVGLGVLTTLMNVVLMVVKLLTGLFGQSYALVADGIESAADVFTSLITWFGYHLSLRPPDEKHPFGHGKIESLTGIFSGLVLLGAAAGIAVMSLREIQSPQNGPKWFTLPVLLLVIVSKEWMCRRILIMADQVDSRALEGDAWHHRSDAITSGAAAIGISLALLGGEAWASADDWAALVACIVIVINGFRIIDGALHDTLDGKVDSDRTDRIQLMAEEVDGVLNTEKCLLRKSGVNYFSELHVEVDPNLTVLEGHRIGHDVKDHVMEAMPEVLDVVIHLEPFGSKD